MALPPGWLVHDGQAIPVAPGSQPGVAFRNGWRVPPAQYAASHWTELGTGFWQHAGGPLDIVAFLPSYGPQSNAQWRAAVRTMIGQRLGTECDERINEGLADDIIALMNSRSPSGAYDSRLVYPTSFGCE